MYGLLILFVVLALSCTGIIRWLVRRDIITKPDWAWGIGVVLVAGSLLAFVLVGGMRTIERYDVHIDSELIAVKDNQFLFAGLAGGKPAFYFYRVEGSGYKLEYIDAAQTIVYEDTIDEAYLRRLQEHVTPRFKARWLHWFVFSDTLVHGAELHVPPGTVQRSFALDAE